MSDLSDVQIRKLALFSALANCNPFLPERARLEQEIVGRASGAPSRGHGDLEAGLPALMAVAEPLAETLHGELASGGRFPIERLAEYRDLILVVLYHRHRSDLGDLLVPGTKSRAAAGLGDLWDRFRRDVDRWFGVPALRAEKKAEAAHLFACAWQIRRAYENIHETIAGTSGATARLRAAIWQSIFTHSMRRYWRSLHGRIGDFTTLISGPSGSGKELVARAIALSRYVPFDVERRRFVAEPAELFHPLNLAALAPTVIESELFGHKKGAFTGALADRVGRLEDCHRLGSVFLDEIGDVDLAIQVKLLRVLETRLFEPLGDTKSKTFHGKIIAATHHDLGAAIAAGRFREDMYYRLCADLVTTPSLAERLREDPGELEVLVRHVVARFVDDEADQVVAEVLAFIKGGLPADYAWPGNIRELEQCVRNVMIRGAYAPPGSGAVSRQVNLMATDLAAEIHRGKLTAEDLLSRYCRSIYDVTGSYEETARRLDLDRRTVKARIRSGEPESSEPA